MSPELSGLINAARAVEQDATTEFGALNYEQLNWKPDAKSWSVGQCFDHLIVSNRQLPKMVAAHLDGTHRKTVFERLPFAPKFFGNMIHNAVRPESPKKVRAPRGFEPTSSDVGADVVAKFSASQRETVAIMEASANFDLHNTVVTSHLSRFVTYTMFDAYRIVVTHARRHFKQARNVVKMPEFPG